MAVSASGDPGVRAPMATPRAGDPGVRALAATHAAGDPGIGTRTAGASLDGARVPLPTAGIHHLALRVTDRERSLRFYHHTLGFELLREADEIVLLRAGGTTIGLRGATGSTPAGDVFDPFRVGMDHVALACADADALARAASALDAAGVRNTGLKVSAVSGSRYVAFWDPDGIKWEYFALG